MLTHPSANHRSHFTAGLLIALLALCGCGGGTSRPEQSREVLLQRRANYRQSYLDETNERYTATLQRTKAQLDDYQAGRRATPPVIDYLVISGGGDWGAFG